MDKNFSASLSRRTGVSGFTLTELAIVLGVIGIVLAAVWIAASSVNENNRTQRAVNQISTIVSNFRTVFNSNQVVNIADSTDITALAINNKFAPNDMIASSASTTLIGPWNNAVGIYSEQTTNTISLTYYGLSQSGCNNLANALANTPGLYWMNISPDGTTANQVARTVAPYGTQSNFTASTIAGICTNTSNNYVAVAFSMN